MAVDRSNLLIFVVGTSGSGKDSVMRETVAYLSTKGIPASTLKRVITRPSDKNEESTYITKEEFLKRKEEFALSWFIYDNWYGCPKDQIEAAMDQKHVLLINISRSILTKARMKFPSCRIVLITVPKDTAEIRIRKRGREDQTGLMKRLTRMKTKIEIPDPDFILQNTGDLKDTAKELGNYLQTIYENKERLSK
jgi:ribose 1,5-bisphosphokinase